MLKVVLDGQAFRELVAGKELVFEFLNAGQVPARIRLADIGFDLMRSAIDEAEAAQWDRAGAPGGRT